MADDDIPANIDATIDSSLGDTAPRRSRKKAQPTYQIVGDSKIPVSKVHGKVWKSRVAQSQQQTKNVRD